MIPTIQVTITEASYSNSDVLFDDTVVTFDSLTEQFGGIDNFTEPRPYFALVEEIKPIQFDIDSMKPTLKEVETF